MPGSPIRTPWDHSSVDSSPRPIAASHVLHRLLVPRHPPCALSNLTTNHTTTPTRQKPGTRVVTGDHKKDARIHCAILNKHTTTTTTTSKHPQPDAVLEQEAVVLKKTPPMRVVFSGPNRVSTATTNRTPRFRSHHTVSTQLRETKQWAVLG